MFSGITEGLGEVTALRKELGNLHITVKSAFTNELKIDQSIAHNGVCLTVDKNSKTAYSVLAIDETLKKTNLSRLKKGDRVNLERAMKTGERMDGHIVQGHVDGTVACISVLPQKGSWIYRFRMDESDSSLVVEKGSICLNGVSLTIVETGIDFFSVAVIPYTFEHTNFRFIKKGDKVNVEFDILGKYVEKQIRSMKGIGLK